MYTLIKLLHVVAVVIFLGNIFTGLYWHRQAARTRDPKLLAHAMEGIIRSDRWFTIPGVVVLVSAGIVLAVLGHFPLLRTGWIGWSIFFMIISGVVFVARVAPLQRELLSLATGADGFSFEQYRKISHRWEFWGGIALVTPAAALVLMVLKPVV